MIETHPRLPEKEGLSNFCSMRCVGTRITVDESELAESGVASRFAEIDAHELFSAEILRVGRASLVEDVSDSLMGNLSVPSLFL